VNKESSSKETKPRPPTVPVTNPPVPSRPLDESSRKARDLKPAADSPKQGVSDTHKAPPKKG
jgi:hypothetical protein